MRGIDHPEVADLAAVSAAVARLRNAAGNAGPHLRCIEAAAKYLGNVLEHPSTEKVGQHPTKPPPQQQNLNKLQPRTNVKSIRVGRATNRIRDSTRNATALRIECAIFLGVMRSYQNDSRLTVLPL